MKKWLIAFIVFIGVFIGVFMTTRELMGNEYSSSNFQDFYIGFKNDLLVDLGVTTEVLGRDNDGIRRKNRILVLDYTLHHESEKLPKLLGYGTVFKSDIAYNANKNLRQLAFLMSKNIIDSERFFDQFMEEWSGFNTLLRTIQKEYKLSSLPIVSETDKQIWILETFSAADVNKHIIEQEIKTTANVMKTGGTPNVRALFYSDENTYVTRQYKNLRDRYSAFFTLQTFYPNVMDGVSYNYSIDEFVIKDLKKFHKNVSNYFNSSKVSIESKLYLANNMHTLRGTFLHFNASEITKNIVDDEMKKIVSAVYDGSFTPVVYKAFNCGNGKGYMLYKQKVDGIYVKTKPYNISNSNNQKADDQCFTSSWLKIETLMVPSTKLSVAK